MSLFSRLFGSKHKSESPVKTTTVEYQGFRITPQPMKEAQGYRLCAVIEKEVGGAAKSHTLIRADTITSLDECNAASIAKARQMIDQQGERLF
ncbi:HlyU family transcriptional regulator [Planktotalea arctica]|uniref:HlyU family transcriptional regulator n=1 Tax=Planktotalea arctica TaxID=1481893 RepID=UPI000A17189C|nr:HlyU family transcriptional regulator [Planktotalea arctica]